MTTSEGCHFLFYLVLSRVFNDSGFADHGDFDFARIFELGFDFFCDIASHLLCFDIRNFFWGYEDSDFTAGSKRI